MGSRTEGRAATVGKWLLAFVVTTSALALGSLQTPVLIVMSALAALACGLLWVSPTSRASRASGWVLVVIGLLLAMTLLQAVPLPAGIVRALAPSNADVWERALIPFREAAPTWHPISIAPGATRVEVLRGVFYGCIFLGALRVAAFEGGGTFLERLVVFSTCALALSSLAHTALSAERVFGIYRPVETYAFRQGRYGSLLNLNHLSAYMDIGACVAVSALVARRTMPRALSLGAAIVLAGTSVWAGSRGGVGALLFGMVLAVGLTLYAKRRFDSSRAQVAILGVCALAAVSMVAIGFSDLASSRLGSRDLTKVQVAMNGLALIPRSPWVGVGRGGFESAFPTVRESAMYVTFTHPENGLVQWTVEWGVPVALVAMAILAWALRPKNVLQAVRPGVGAWVAVVAVVLSDLVDFHLEVPGIVALVAVCVAIAIGGRMPSDSSSGRSRDRESASSSRSGRQSGRALVVTRHAAFAFTGAAVVAIIWAIPVATHSLAEDRRSLSAKAMATTTSAEEFREELHAAILRYPGEAFFPLMGAVRAQTLGEGSVVPWIARALERNPRFGRAHFVLARSLAATNRAPQARLEYRLAYQHDEALREPIVREASRLIDGADAALEVVPPGPEGVAMLDALVLALQDRLPSTAAVLDAELAKRSPGTASALERQVRAALSDVRHRHAWCGDRTTCVDAGLATAATLVQRVPDKCEPHVLVARLRIEKGETAAALDGLEHAMETVSDRPDCQRTLIDLAFEVGDKRRAGVALDRLVRAGCGAAAECIDLYVWAADAEQRRNNNVRAISLYRRALDVAPDREDLLERIGELGGSAGGSAEGIAAYESLARRHPDDPRWPARIAELRSTSLKRPLPVVPP